VKILPNQNKNSNSPDIQPEEGNQEIKISSSNEEQSVNQKVEALLITQILQNLQALNEGVNQLLETQSILIKDITDLKLRFDEQ